jgi:hypothetical protein
VLGATSSRAHPNVVKLHAALLLGKQDGALEFDGIGRLSWPETVALADVLLGTFWTAVKYPERQMILRKKESDLGVEVTSDGRLYGSRYRGLSLLAWLLDGWPRSPGPRIAIDLLGRWSEAKRSRISGHLHLNWSDPYDPGPYELDPKIRMRLWILR